MEKNIAVVGCGYWGRNLVRNFAQLGALHTICDADPKVLAQLASNYPEVNTESEYSRILHNEGVKGVVIATPAALHYSMGKQALLADKDTFVEKPLSLHLQEVYKPLGYKPGDFPESERAQGEVLSVPMYPELEDQEIEEIAKQIEIFCERQAGV